MFPFTRYNAGGDNFRSELDSSLTRGGPSGLAYPESNKYALKQQLLETHEDQRFSNLKLKQVDHNGDRRRKVYALDGTIPIVHENGHFNIPIEVVIPPDFPVTAPAPFVRPTATMCLAPTHAFVDVSTGAVNTPAVVSWTYPSSKLVSCLAEMSSRFGEVSPVYARTAKPPPSPSTSSPHAHPPSSSLASPYGTNYKPQTPPSPDRPTAAPADAYGSGAGSFFPNPLRAPAASPPAHPSSMYPSYPPLAPVGRPQYPPPSNPYTSPSPHVHTPMGDPPAYGMPGAGPRPPQLFQNTSGHFHPPQPAVSAGWSAEAANRARRTAAFRRTAVEALTDRVTASLKHSEAGVQDETDKLLVQKAQLDENRKVIAHACAEKKAELRVLERNVTELSSTNAALRAWLQVNEPKAAALPDTVTPEDVIVPMDSLCQQALSAQAEDMAIEEAMQVLHDSLRSKSVTLEMYIKACRELAEKQFRARLLGNKLQQQQYKKTAAAEHSSGVVYPGDARLRGGVMMPQGDNWRLTATYMS